MWIYEPVPVTLYRNSETLDCVCWLRGIFPQPLQRTVEYRRRMEIETYTAALIEHPDGSFEVVDLFYLSALTTPDSETRLQKIKAEWLANPTDER